MSILQGKPLPDVTTTRTETQTGPDYYTDYLTALSGEGESYLGKTGAELVADIDPLQEQAYRGVGTAAGAYIPGLTRAQQTAQRATGVTPERISAFMDPYRSSVVDELARISQQNVQRNVLPQFKAGFVGSGGLGSQRYAGALGQSLADIQANLQGQQGALLSKGYQDAVKNAFDQLAAERESAALESDLATVAQTLGLSEMEALSKMGGQKMAYDQSLIDAPLRTAENVSKLLRNYQIPLDRTTVETGPKSGVYGLSDFDKISGILSLIGAYGAPTGTTKEGMFGRGLEQIFKIFKDQDIDIGAILGGGSDYTVNPAEDYLIK
jgi:hypothetical protein